MRFRKRISFRMMNFFRRLVATRKRAFTIVFFSCRCLSCYFQQFFHNVIPFKRHFSFFFDFLFKFSQFKCNVFIKAKSNIFTFTFEIRPGADLTKKIFVLCVITHSFNDFFQSRFRHLDNFFRQYFLILFCCHGSYDFHFMHADFRQKFFKHRLIIN